MHKLSTVTIVGVGLIGGSIGLGLRARNLADEVVGAGSRRETLDTALQRGAIDRLAETIEDAVSTAELVVVCTPVGHVVDHVRRLAPHCPPHALITDAGSTKSHIVRALDDADASWPEGVRFLGSHPLAGNEKRGPLHASAELFAGRTVVITPGARSRPEDGERLARFWQALGAAVVEMSADEHDRALALTSHLPHLVAAALARATPSSYAGLTAGGWKDTTRIAAGDPPLWRQIFAANRENLLAALDAFAAQLSEWRAALASDEHRELEALLADAKRRRDAAQSEP